MIKAKLHQLNIRTKFKIENPGVDLPEHMDDDFNLPCALSTLVMEIVELRAEIEMLK